MDPEVPLVVPEVNRGDLAKHKGIIANQTARQFKWYLRLNQFVMHLVLTK